MALNSFDTSGRLGAERPDSDDPPAWLACRPAESGDFHAVTVEAAADASEPLRTDPPLVLTLDGAPPAGWDGCHVPMPAGFTILTETGSAYTADLAGLAIRLISRCAGISAETAQRMDLLVQELVSNAIVHGNLGVASFERQSPHAFFEYCTELERRLNDPGRACRKVYLSVGFVGGDIFVIVRDEGEGYDYRARRPAAGDDNERGLGLMAKQADDVWVDCGGRRTSLLFRGLAGR
jgi:anti-sigma regulatory factor (Ser/Thr protein kinase)